MKPIQKFRNLERETKLDIIELSRGYLGVLLISLFLWNISTASALYSGESMSFETNLINPVYIVTGNSSNLEGLNITFENGNITISPVINYKPDNFTLIFFDNITNEIIKEIRVGGGGGGTRYIKENVTVYVPEYIDKIVNNTEEIEVEKIIKEIVYKKDYSFSIFLAIISSLFLVTISQIISYFYYKKHYK